MNPLGVEKIHKLLVRFSLPAIVGMTVNSLYNVVDRIFIGNSPDLGADGLAGITVAFPLMILLLSVGILFGLGGATIFSIRLGEGRQEAAEHALGNAFTLLAASGVLFLLLGQAFVRPLLAAFGAGGTVLPHAVAYMRVVLFGAVFQMGSIGLNNFIRADGNPKIAMQTMFLGAGTNILLDPVFIFGLRMGMAGAALATVLAQGLSYAWVVSYFLGKRSRSKLRLRHLRPEPGLVGRIAVLGLPESSLQVANSLLNAILNKSLFVYGGAVAVSAMGIVNSLQMLLLLPVIGLRQGLQPIVSFNFGAGKHLRVKQAVRLGLAAATGMVAAGYIVTRIFPEQLVGLFNREPELLHFGARAIRAWLLLMPVVGVQIVGASFFQATGRYRSALFLTLTRQLLLLVPALLVFPRLWGLEGLLHAAPFADFFSFALTAVWLHFGLQGLGKGATKE
ncbi:MATE family efflux transporter [Anaerotalea alkaliphila]|uniref:MATE family efflux transporter n=1 Tax=Anaerotalea alkaliphila TaxID=2662126 RepID=UPI0031B571A4